MSRNGKRFMKILVLSYEAWNDITNGNNVTSNWFEGMDAEFANIYARARGCRAGRKRGSW